MDSAKDWFRSRQTWFGLVIIILGGLIGWLESSPLDPTVVGLVASALGVAIVYLRRITSTAIAGSSASIK